MGNRVSPAAFFVWPRARKKSCVTEEAVACLGGSTNQSRSKCDFVFTDDRDKGRHKC